MNYLITESQLESLVEQKYQDKNFDRYKKIIMKMFPEITMMFLGDIVVGWSSSDNKDYQKQIIKVVFDPRKIAQGEYFDGYSYDAYLACKKVRKFMMYDLNMDFSQQWDLDCYQITLKKL